MKKIFLLIVVLFAFLSAFSVSPPLITQERADEIVLQRMQEDSFYFIYAKDGLQQQMTITTSAGEELELNYPCWVYYARRSIITCWGMYCYLGRYLIVNESTGNLLEVNKNMDIGPSDLAEWRKLTEIATTSCAEIAIDYLYNECENPLCEEYRNIWKEIFIEKNGLTEQYFSDHINIVNSHINDWNDGISISIGYTVKIDWAFVYTSDYFIIKIKEGTMLYPSLNVPRGVFLTKENIKTVIAARAFSSEIIKLTPNEILKFNSKDNAFNFLIKQAKVSTLCLNKIYIDKVTGHISLKAWAEYDNEWNRCIEANLDLINEEAEIRDNPCWIN